MTLRLVNITSELVGLSPNTPVRAKLPSGDVVEVELEIIGLDDNSEVQVILHVPLIGAQFDMTENKVTTRPEGGKNPDTTSAAGPAMDPVSGISPPEAIPEDQGTYQDQNREVSEEEVAQEAANLTGNTTDGVEPENKLGTEEDEDSSEDSPATSRRTPSEPRGKAKASKSESDEFKDLDD